MKKGQRRKDNRRKNKPQRRPGHKRKGLRPNPMFGATMDQGAMRAIVNQAIGSVLIGTLGIDFVGMLEKRAEDELNVPETIQ